MNNPHYRGRVPLVSIALIALVAHEMNRAYCQSIGDISQPSWQDAPDWQKKSAVNGVVFHLQHDADPEASHKNWMAEKLRDGWTYGAEKDPVKKTHPCLVSYHLLPDAQRAKDFLFRGAVHALSIPTPDGEGETTPIVNVDQFAHMLSQWHGQTVAKVKQMQDIPEGSQVAIDEGKTITLEGDTLLAFKTGLLTALADFEALPFVSSSDEAPEPAAANDATPSGQ